MEQTIAQIIAQFGPQIWLAFVTFVVTGFVMITLKNFVQDLVNYFKVRMSDLGYGAMVIYQGKLKRVAEIKFKKIKLIDDEEIVFVPISSWLNSVQIYPQPRHDQFDEKKWETNPWDGRTERRESDVKNGMGSNA